MVASDLSPNVSGWGNVVRAGLCEVAGLRSAAERGVQGDVAVNAGGP